MPTGFYATDVEQTLVIVIISTGLCYRSQLRIGHLLREDLIHNMAMNVGQSAVDAVLAIRQAFVVDPQQMQYGGMKIVAVGAALDRLVSPVIAVSVADACLDAGPRQPGNERPAVVVPAISALGKRRSAKFRRPNQ